MIKAIIFDLDGVLVETKDIHFLALNLALKKILNINNAISYKDHLNKYDGLPTKEKLKILFKTKLSKANEKRVNLEKQKITSNLIKKKLYLTKKFLKLLNIFLKKIIQFVLLVML